jgi:hypothetical protein
MKDTMTFVDENSSSKRTRVKQVAWIRVGRLERKKKVLHILVFVYICIVFGDPFIKRAGLVSH